MTEILNHTIFKPLMEKNVSKILLTFNIQVYNNEELNNPVNKLIVRK